jgi:hypothetical protein
MRELVKNLSTIVILSAIIFCTSSFKTRPPAYERLKSGDILNCAFYNADSFTIIEFKNGYLDYARWSGTPGNSGEYKIEEYTLNYTYSKNGMCGNINGIPFMIIDKSKPNAPAFYMGYNGLGYFLSDRYSE